MVSVCHHCGSGGKITRKWAREPKWLLLLLRLLCFKDSCVRCTLDNYVFFYDVSLKKNKKKSLSKQNVPVLVKYL